ncbi:MAG TPA: hypothetical protein P5119_03525 [Candidatus Aminicenantes bacterium]|nr:hypothetical protein [Candidatus Aminicenantes bacterium]HRY64394.1 hypothetical protein [Candidatus Aminicenantes bacterium]HRZ71307.1 hypothetical protein [Candidatus Aminicenantes bacterium]
MSGVPESERPAVEPAQLVPFDGFPYLVTRIVAAFYHIILLPAEYGRSILMDIARRQVFANRLKTCLVFGQAEFVYFDEDGSPAPGTRIPRSTLVTSGRLIPCQEFARTEDLERRAAHLEAFVTARARNAVFYGDLTKGGRQATAQELVRFAGADIDGTPKGLEICDVCGGWRGECLDPSPLFKERIMRVHCWCENDNRCARCGRSLYEYKLNANFYDPSDRGIWHVPGFCGLDHVCRDLH